MKSTANCNVPYAANGQNCRCRNLCDSCALFDLCRPQAECTQTPPPLEPVAKHPQTLKKGEFLFRVGDPFRALFLIQSGSVKTSILSHGGNVQILRFALPRELLGVNAIATARYPSEAVALETTQLCELAFAQLETLAQTQPDVQHRLLRLLSDEIARDEKLMAMLGHQKADVRLADCLLDFHRRCPRTGQTTGAPFRLPMSRQDIADYLGLSLETVSRLLSRFQMAGLLHVQGRQVQLLDIVRLQSIGNPGTVVPARLA
jgi:CRP/FNR family transcriptional regulator